MAEQDCKKCNKNPLNNPPAGDICKAPSGVCSLYVQALGLKFDQGKLRTSLLTVNMVECIEAIAKVLTFGAKKYADNSWQEVPNAKIRYREALDRHLMAHSKGEIFDAESELPHMAHAACCMMFLLWLDIQELKNVF